MKCPEKCRSFSNKKIPGYGNYVLEINKLKQVTLSLVSSIYKYNYLILVYQKYLNNESNTNKK